MTAYSFSITRPMFCIRGSSRCHCALQNALPAWLTIASVQRWKELGRGRHLALKTNGIMRYSACLYGVVVGRSRESVSFTRSGVLASWWRRRARVKATYLHAVIYTVLRSWCLRTPLCISTFTTTFRYPLTIRWVWTYSTGYVTVKITIMVIQWYESVVGAR